MEIEIESRKEVVGEQRFDGLDRFSVSIGVIFKERKESFDFLVEQVSFGTALLSCLSSNYKPTASVDFVHIVLA